MDAVIALLNESGRWLIAQLGRMSLELFILAGLVLAALYVLRVKSPALRHLFWGLLLVKPVVTFLVASPLSLYALPWPPIPKFLTTQTPVVVEVQTTPTATPLQSVPASRLAPTTELPRVEPPPAWWKIDRYGVAATLWILVASALGLRLLLGCACVAFLRGTALNQREGFLLPLLDEANGALKTHRRVRIALTPVAHGPVLAGVFRPVILLPESMAGELTPRQLKLVITHELAHARRWDNLVLLIQRLAEVFFFFHPVVWLCGWMMRHETEAACDDIVVSAYGDTDGEGAAAYADSLTRVAEMKCGITRRLLVNTFAAAESNFNRRIRRILSGRRTRMTPWLSAVAGMALILIGAFGLPTASSASEATSAANAKPGDFVGTWYGTMGNAAPLKLDVCERTGSLEVALYCMAVDPANVPVRQEVPLKPAVLKGSALLLEENRPTHPARLAFTASNGVLDFHFRNDGEFSAQDLAHPGVPFSKEMPELARLFDSAQVAEALDVPLSLAAGRHTDCKVLVGDATGDALNQSDQRVTLPVAEDSDNGARVKSAIEEALEQTVSLEYTNEYLGNIASDLSDRFNLNLVIDKRVVRPKDAAQGDYVTDGMLAYINLKNVALHEALKAILKPLQLDYSVQEGFLWISTPLHLRTETFDTLETQALELGNVPPEKQEKIMAMLRESVPDVFEPGTGTPISSATEDSDNGARVKSAVEEALEQTVSLEYTNEYLGDIASDLSDRFNLNLVIDNRVVRPKDAAQGDYVTDGMLPYVNLKNIALREALKAILKPLQLDYSVQEGFLWISTPLHLRTETFDTLETQAMGRK